jgi:adenosylhomocysteine nucleosidase
VLGIVVGLAAEARIARSLGCPVAIGGGAAAGAARAAQTLVAQGVTGLVSFGLAGGLAPGLPAGSILVPERVVDAAGGWWMADATLSARLGSPAGSLLAVADIVATAAAKDRLWQESGALAADIESGAVASCAAASGLGFAVLRAVCDPAERDLPPAAVTALDSAGRIRTGALLRSLARRPGQVVALVALGRDAAAARSALLARVRSLGSLAHL